MNELKEETEDLSSNGEDTHFNYAMNYRTCFSFLNLLKNAVKAISARIVFHVFSLVYLFHVHGQPI